MFCPHCHNKIPDGSNICPLCYANLAGMKPQSSGREEPQGEHAQQAKPRSKKPAYSKGSRGSRRSADRTPMIIAFGLIVILIVIIAMIIRSMFSAGSPGNVAPTAEPTAPTQNAPEGNFFVFGATPEPENNEPQEPTQAPALEITPSPAPTAEVTYKTLRKGDQGRDVETLQRALAQLGYLSGAQDGNFGTGTETAVKNFQEANGLSADGIAGKMTLEALYTQVSYTPAPQTTVNPGDVLDLPG